MAVHDYMTITCNAAISACGKGREWPRVLDVLGVMARSSIQIDTITCNVAVSACEKGGERAHALDILGNMARSSIAMATITCNADTEFALTLITHLLSQYYSCQPCLQSLLNSDQCCVQTHPKHTPPLAPTAPMTTKFSSQP